MSNTCQISESLIFALPKSPIALRYAPIFLKIRIKKMATIMLVWDWPINIYNFNIQK